MYRWRSALLLNKCAPDCSIVLIFLALVGSPLASWGATFDPPVEIGSYGEVNNTDIVANGSNVFLAYRTNAKDSGAAYYARRTAGVWGSPQRVSPIDNIKADQPAIWLDGGSVLHYFYKETPNGASEADIWTASDSGLGISTAQSWNSTPGFADDHPELARDSLGRLHLVYRGNDGDREIYYSVRDGSLWSAPLQLTNDTVAQDQPVIAIDGANVVHIAFRDDTTGSGDIYYTNDALGSFAVPIQISSDAQAEDQLSIVAESNGSVHIAWRRQPKGESDIFYVTNQGGSFGAPVGIDLNPGKQHKPRLALGAGDIVYLVYAGEDAGGDNEVFLADNSLGTMSVPVAVTNNTLDDDSPDIFVTAGKIHLAYLQDKTKVMYTEAATGTEVADLQLGVSVFGDKQLTGDTYTLHVDVTNNGPQDATGVAITTTQPPQVVYQGHTTLQGIYTPATETWSVGDVGTGSTIRLDITYLVGPVTGAPNEQHTASVSSTDQSDPNSNDNSASVGLTYFAGSFVVVADTWLDQGNPGANYGTDPELLVETNGVTDRRALLKWDLSLVPAGAVIDTAFVNLWPLSAGATSLEVHRVSGAWSENTATWTNAATIFDPSVELSFAVDGSLETFDLTDLVQQWVSGTNDGIMLIADGGGGPEAIKSREASPIGQRPKITLGYTLTNDVADLSARVTFDSPSVTVGDTIQSTVVLRNAGPDPAGDPRVANGFSPGLQVLSSSAQQGSYSGATWFAGQLAPGDSTTLQFELLVNASAPAQVTHTATASDAGSIDANATDDQDSGVAQVLTADLRVSKTVDNPVPAVNDVVNFHIVVNNDGPNDTSWVDVTDALPPDLDFVAANPSQGGYSNTTNLWNTQAIATGDSVFLDLQARVLPGSEGSQIVNTASITGSELYDPNAANDTSQDSVLVAGAMAEDVVLVQSSQSSAQLLPGGAPQSMLRVTLGNTGTGARRVTSLTIADATVTTSTPTRAELDAQFSQLSLLFDGAQVATASMVLGEATFANLQAEIPAGTERVFEVHAGASILSRDTDQLDLRIADASEIVIATGQSVQGAFPIDPSGSFEVTGMSAAQIQIIPLPSTTYLIGSQDNLALDFIAPRNGYQDDSIQVINVVNYESQFDASFISAMKAWSDDGDGNFDTNLDTPLGQFAFSGARWELTGIEVPVGVGGQRIFVAVDIHADAVGGERLQLGIPPTPYGGLGMATGNHGPIDLAVAEPSSRSVSVPDRVTVASSPVMGGAVDPDARDVPLLDIVLTNDYEQIRDLNRVEVVIEHSLGSGPGFDDAFRNMNLIVDTNANGTIDGPSLDSRISSTSVSLGRAVFSGFALGLPQESSVQIWVTADFAPENVVDSDAVSARISSITEMGFSGDTIVAGQFPLTSQNAWTIDGMLAIQILSRSVSPIVLGPSEGPVLAMDVVIPANGFSGDTLDGLTLANLGTATATDIGELRLYRDDGNGIFEPGPESDLGAFTPVGGTGTWVSPFLVESLVAPGGRFFVGLTAAASATDSSTVRLSIVPGGVQVQSDNDGPRDVSVDVDNTILLSTAPLIASLEFERGVSTVGQSFEVRMAVRNRSGGDFVAVTPGALSSSGSGSISLVTGPTPASADLVDGASVEFVWTFAGDSPGAVQLVGDASGTEVSTSITRSSLPASSGQHRVFSSPDEMGLIAVGSIPFTVNRGQQDIDRMVLTLTNFGDADGANIHLESLRLAVEDDQGQPIVPSSVLSRIVMKEGATVYFDSSSLPNTESEVVMVPATPVQVTTSEPVSIRVEIGVTPDTVVPNFRIVLADASWIVGTDANSGAPVSVALEEDEFPIRGGLVTVLASPTALDVTVPTPLVSRVNPGQPGLVLLDTSLHSAGIDGLTTDVRVSRLEVHLTDTGDNPLANPADYLGQLKVETAFQTHFDQVVQATADTVLVLEFSPQISVPVNTPIAVRLMAELNPDAPIGTFHAQLGVPSTIEARDPNAHEIVPVTYVQGSRGHDVVVEVAADAVQMAAAPLFPPAVGLGAADVQAVSIQIVHPGSAGTAQIRLDSFAVRCFDERRVALAPDVFLDAVDVYVDDQLAQTISTFPAGAQPFIVAIPSLWLDPADTVNVELRIDSEASAPTSFFELTFLAEDMVIVDANSGTPIEPSAVSGQTFPLSSGVTQFVPTARDLEVGLSSTMPAVLSRSGRDVAVGELSLENIADQEAGPIRLRSLTMRTMDESGGALPDAQVLRRVYVTDGEAMLASSDTLMTGEPATVDFSPPLEVEAATVRSLQLFIDLVDDPATDQFFLQIDQVDVDVIQPLSAQLQIQVSAATSQAFPLQTKSGTFSAQGLSESYVNYPNPFAAGRELTNFAFNLEANAEVSLALFDLTGNRVITLLDGDDLPAGLVTSAVWDGRNGKGRTVRNGVYLAVLNVRYADGRTQEERRTVAVVR